MKTVGQVLQEARLAQHLELTQVAEVTKIRPQFLSLLEADNFQKLPNATVARGFISNYSQMLGLRPKQVLAIFRRDFVENDLGQIMPRGMVEPVAKESLWTPKSTIIAIVVCIVIVFIGYISYQYWLLIGPPTLTLTYPTSDLTTSKNTVEVVGSTDPEATISVNGQLVVLEKGGQFYVRLPLSPGLNHVTVLAKNKSGKASTIIRKVFLDTTVHTP
jgi:cytoskeletal protein RodZ